MPRAIMKETEVKAVKEEVFMSNSHGAHSRIRPTVDIDAIDYSEASDIVDPFDLNGIGPSQENSQ